MMLVVEIYPQQKKNKMQIWSILCVMMAWRCQGIIWPSTMYSQYIAELDISWSLVGPHFWRPRAWCFSWNCGTFLDLIRRRQFFVKSAQRDSLCSHSQETVLCEINSSLPVNAGWNTCHVMVSYARQSIYTSIVLQNRVQLIQCQCKSWLQIFNLGINKSFLIKWSLFTSAIVYRHWDSSTANQECAMGRYSYSSIGTPK